MASVVKKVDDLEKAESVNTEENDSDAQDKAKASDSVLCPFVCGICTEKFDKVSKFYAHLKTHSNFESIAKSSEKKNEMLEALNVAGKVDDNVFTCGVCNIDFPSMSLLHQHMVEEEKISSYNYCEKDHTARANKQVDQQSKQSETVEDTEKTKTPKRGRGRPRKYPVTSPPNKTDTLKQPEEESIQTPKSKRGRKRRIDKDSRNSDELDDKESTVLKKHQNTEQSQMNSPRYGTRRSSGRVNYKLLAGYGKSYDSDDSSDKLIKSEEEDEEGDSDNEFVQNTPKKIKIEKEIKTKATDSRMKENELKPDMKPDFKPKTKVMKLDGSEAVNPDALSSKDKNDDSIHSFEETKVEELGEDEKAAIEDEAAAEAFLMLSEMNEDDETDKDTNFVYVTAESDNPEIQNGNRSSSMNKSYLFSCNVCGIVLSGKALRKHRVSHLKAAHVKCNICGKRYKSSLHLSHHKRSVHKQPYLKCPKCLKVCKGKQSIERHMALHILKKEVEEKSIDDIVYEEIEPEDADKEDYEEDVSDDAFESSEEQTPSKEGFENENLETEFRAGNLHKESSKPGDTRVQCVLCKGIFKHKKSFNRHMHKIHLCEKYKCEICEVPIRTDSGYEKHMKMHSEEDVNGSAVKVVDDKAETDNQSDSNGIEEGKEVKVLVSNEEEEDLDEKKLYEDMDEQAEITEATEVDEERKSEGITENEMPVNEKGTETEDLNEDTEGTGTGKVIVVQLDKSLKKKKNSFQCGLCPFVARCKEGLAKHQIIHSPAVNQICDICERIFDSVKQLERHKADKHNLFPYTCNICGEQLKAKQSIYGHKAKHLMKTDQYYSEEVVEKLQKEMAEESKTKVKKVKGPVINKPSGETYMDCHVCGKQIRAKRLQRHLEVHIPTKDHKCDICGKFYKSARYLKDHIKKTHEKGKDSVCELCGNIYKGQRYLEIHMQTHGPRDKICQYCGKGFTTALYLKTHLQTHLEKKSFKCQECGSGFSHRTRLMIHMAEAHGHGQKKECKYCKMIFMSRQKARIHERRVHEGYKTKKRIKRNRGSNRKLPQNLEYYIVNQKPGAPDQMVIQYYTEDPANKGQQIVAVTDDNTVDSVKVEAEEAANEVNKMRDKQDDVLEKEFELVEVAEGEEGQSFVIQQCDEDGQPITTEIQAGDKNFDHQVLEIPEDTEQCQLILYPDGTFKLLNILDASKASENAQ